MTPFGVSGRWSFDFGPSPATRKLGTRCLCAGSQHVDESGLWLTGLKRVPAARAGVHVGLPLTSAGGRQLRSSASASLRCTWLPLAAHRRRAVLATWPSRGTAPGTGALARLRNSAFICEGCDRCPVWNPTP